MDFSRLVLLPAYDCMEIEKLKKPKDKFLHIISTLHLLAFLFNKETQFYILFIFSCFFNNILLHHKPQCTGDADRRIGSADNTYHQRQSKFTDTCHTKDIQYRYHDKGGKGSIDTS